MFQIKVVSLLYICTIITFRELISSILYPCSETKFGVDNVTDINSTALQMMHTGEVIIAFLIQETKNKEKKNTINPYIEIENILITMHIMQLIKMQFTFHIIQTKTTIIVVMLRII